jgi:DNA repair photolyase
MNNEVIESLTHTNQEILNHLRLLGEEKARKRQKKEVKREVKHRINKIYKEPDYDEEEDDRERVIIIQKPQYQRRRLNLLND